MRPDGLGCTTIRLTFTGIDHIDEIYVSVIVRIVVSPVDAELLIRQTASFYHGICSMLVIAIIVSRVVCTIIGHIATKVHRTKHVKLRTISAIGLICKILTSRRITGIDCTVKRVAEFIERSLRVTALHALIAEINQDDHALRSEIRFRSDILALTTSNSLSTTRFRYFGSRCLANYFVHAIYFTYAQSFFVNGIVIEFISNHLYFDGRTISLRACLPSATSRHCISSKRHGAQHHRHKNFLHKILNFFI